MMNRDDAAAAWTPEHWRSCLATTAEQLSVLANAAIEIGDFWITAYRDSTSLIARIRSFGALPGLACDLWEGSLAIAKRLEGVSADLEVFPFVEGRRVTPPGQFWGLWRAAPGSSPEGWKRRGWCFPDGGGEWDWVQVAGDCFAAFHLEAELLATGAEDLIHVSFGDLRAGSTLVPPSTEPVALAVAVHERAGGELSATRADARPRVLWDEGPAWTAVVPREASSVTVSVPGGTHSEAGGRLVLRVEYLHAEEGHARSALTKPLLRR